MENVKIWIDGVQKDVFGLFYIFDSKYYFIYTEKELDENDYVILYMTMVGKETKNTENGAIETGAMIGVEITNPEEQQKAQTAISYIVEDKKNNTVNSKIQYLPMNMIKELKIVSKKRFRLLKTIMEENFKLDLKNEKNILENSLDIQPITPVEPVEPVITEIPQSIQNNVSVEDVIPVTETLQQLPQSSNIDENVIIDYRSKYFEEQEKNKELQEQVETLTQKLEDIKKVIN